LESKCQATTVDGLFEPDVSLEAYQWIIYQLLQLTSENLKQLASEGVDSFTAKNELQAYYYRPLNITYAELGKY